MDQAAEGEKHARTGEEVACPRIECACAECFSPVHLPVNSTCGLAEVLEGEGNVVAPRPATSSCGNVSTSLPSLIPTRPGNKATPCRSHSLSC